MARRKSKSAKLSQFSENTAPSEESVACAEEEEMASARAARPRLYCVQTLHAKGAEEGRAVCSTKKRGSSVPLRVHVWDSNTPTVYHLCGVLEYGTPFLQCLSCLHVQSTTRSTAKLFVVVVVVYGILSAKYELNFAFFAKHINYATTRCRE